MSTSENPNSFGSKLNTLIKTSIAGVIAQDPPPEVNEVMRQSFRTAESPYRSLRAYSNPPLDFLEQDVINLALQAKSSEINSLPWSEEKFSQGYHLASMTAFSDQHSARLPESNFVPELSREFVNKVIEISDEKGRQITIPEQLAIAMRIANGSILGAAVIAHAGSRSIARGSDTRLNERFRYTTEELKHWRDCVSSFDAISGQYDDPPSETYHFWGTFISGLLSETGNRGRDKLFNPAYRHIYTNMGKITEILRYRISKKEGLPHETADVLGYHLGSMVGSAVQLQKKA